MLADAGLIQHPCRGRRGRAMGGGADRRAAWSHAATTSSGLHRTSASRHGDVFSSGTGGHHQRCAVAQCAYRAELGVGKAARSRRASTTTATSSSASGHRPGCAECHARSVVRIGLVAVGQHMPRRPQILRHLGRCTWTLLGDQDLHGVRAAIRCRLLYLGRSRPGRPRDEGPAG